MAAYSPRTDLLTPTVAPDTQGYGPGIAAGMSSFTSLVSQGIANKRQDQRDAKLWDQQLTRDKANYDHDYTMLDKRTAITDKKELASKQEESEFAAGAWEAIKAKMPDVITPDLNNKFYQGNDKTKNGLLVQSQAVFTAAMRSQLEADEREAKAKAAQTWAPAPSTDAYQINGLGNMVPPIRTKPPSGFNDMGNGVGAVYGPDGKPMNPAYLLKQGPAGMEPAMPKPPPPLRIPPDRMIDKKPYRINMQTGAYEPIPVQSGTGNPNADVFNQIQ